jgi:hypothetical protein
VKIKILIAAAMLAGFIVCFLLFSGYWWAFVIAGALLLCSGLVLTPVSRKQSPAGAREAIQRYQQEAGMELPTTWSEPEVKRGLMRYAGDQSLLNAYVRGLMARFIDEADTKTADRRLDFLEKQSALFTGTIENYRLWRRVGRVKHEEDAEDVKAKALEKAQERKNKLQALEDQAKEEQLLTVIEEERKKREDLRKPVPVQVKSDDPEERKERERKRIKDDLVKIQRDIEALDADGTMNQTQKRKMKNLLEDKQDRLFEQLEKHL